MAHVYLETSFFGACVSTRTGAKSLGWLVPPQIVTPDRLMEVYE